MKKSLAFLNANERWIIVFIISFLLLFSGMRLTLLLSSWTFFQKLPLSLTLFSFISGLRFDLSILLMTGGFSLLMLFFPIPSRAWRLLWKTLATIVAATLMAVNISDILFFSQANHHIGNEVMLIKDDIPFLLSMFKAYWYWIAFWLMASTLTLLFVWKHDYKISQTSERWKIWPIKLVLFLIFLYFGVMGKVGIRIDRSISVAEAFFTSSSEAGNLSLNGSFSAFHMWWGNRKNDIRIKHFQTSEAQGIALENFYSPNEIIPDPLFPLERKLKSEHKENKPNILFILLESWSAKYLFKGDTPNFDQLTKEGLYFDNFYPNGGMSPYGIMATMTSVPTLPRIPVLGRGFEVYKFFRPGEVLGHEGYSSFFAQGAIRISFRMNSVSQILGFQEFFGKEDFTPLYQTQSNTNGWDEELYQFTNKHIDQIKPPFFGLVFTGSTHIPYRVPDERFIKHPMKDLDESGFQNTLYYADYALGEFLKEARKKPWFDNTIFIFTADHTLARQLVGEEAKTPLLIYAPKFIKPKRSSTLGSQVDIMPTLASLLNAKWKYSGIGRNLLEEMPERFVLSFEPPNVAYINDHGHISHSLEKMIKGTLQDPQEINKSERRLLGFEQMLWELMLANKLYQN